MVRFSTTGPRLSKTYQATVAWSGKSEPDAVGYDFLSQRSVRGLSRQATDQEGDECPVQVGFGVLGQAFVVAHVATGVHAPADREIFPTPGQDDEALDALGPGDDA